MCGAPPCRLVRIEANSREVWSAYLIYLLRSKQVSDPNKLHICDLFFFLLYYSYQIFAGFYKFPAHGCLSMIQHCCHELLTPCRRDCQLFTDLAKNQVSTVDSIREQKSTSRAAYIFSWTFLNCGTQHVQRCCNIALAVHERVRWLRSWPRLRYLLISRQTPFIRRIKHACFVLWTSKLVTFDAIYFILAFLIGEHSQSTNHVGSG